MTSVYGDPMHETRYEGLADSKSSEEYEQRLTNWLRIWEYPGGGDRQGTSLLGMVLQIQISRGRGERSYAVTSSGRSRPWLAPSPVHNKWLWNSEAMDSMIAKWISKSTMTWDRLANSLQNFKKSKYRELEMVKEHDKVVQRETLECQQSHANHFSCMHRSSFLWAYPCNCREEWILAEHIFKTNKKNVHAHLILSTLCCRPSVKYLAVARKQVTERVQQCNSK